MQLSAGQNYAKLNLIKIRSFLDVSEYTIVNLIISSILRYNKNYLILIW